MHGGTHCRNVGSGRRQRRRESELGGVRAQTDESGAQLRQSIERKLINMQGYMNFVAGETYLSESVVLREQPASRRSVRHRRRIVGVDNIALVAFETRNQTRQYAKLTSCKMLSQNNNEYFRSNIFF